MPKGKLTKEGEVIAAYGAAMVAAFQVLINCLEESDALLPGQFPEALSVYMEMVKSRQGNVSDLTLAVARYPDRGRSANESLQSVGALRGLSRASLGIVFSPVWTVALSRTHGTPNSGPITLRCSYVS